MITFLKTWANQIIVALIIATIFEMLLPNGNNKKYVKMIIGLYVLFTIIQPVITKITGNNLELSEFNYKKYFDKEVIESSSKDFEENNSKLIEQAYIDNIKNDIKIKLKQKGYEVISCNNMIESNENKDNYGTIKKLALQIKKIEAEEEKTNNTIKVEDVEISLENDSSNTSTQEKINISEKDKKQLIEYLSNEYSIPKENITIN